MSGPVEFVKKHPLMTGASVIALIGVIVLAGGSGGGGQVVQSGPTPESIAANTQITLASMESQAQAQNTAAQLNVSLARIGQEDRATTLAAQIEQQRLALASTVSLKEIDSQTESHLASVEANRQIQIGAQTAATEQARIDAETQRYAAGAAASAQKSAAKSSSTASIIGSVIGLAGLFFSDARLKTDCRLIRVVDGVKWYRYRWNTFARERYGFSNETSEGVLAQEVLRTKYRAAVTMDHHTGYYTVNYPMLAEMQQQRRTA